jgi:DnaK suppressor protein
LRVRIQSGIHARLIRRTGAFSGPKPIRKPANFAEEKTASSAPNTDTTAVLDFKPYKPKRGEEYMNDKQVEHFQNILLSWKRQLMEEVDRTLHHMQDEAANFPDPNDRATQESEFTLELRTRDRERKLIKKIDESLATLDNGDYGFCETCGIEIGIRRLEARPTATLCIDCKVLDEIREKQMG